MSTRKENLRKRIENVKRIVEDNYEPGNQKKCKLQAYRFSVMQVYPMSERTFWRYMNTDVDENVNKNEMDNRQLSLDF
jgi:hypothetical protein